MGGGVKTGAELVPDRLKENAGADDVVFEVEVNVELEDPPVGKPIGFAPKTGALEVKDAELDGIANEFTAGELKEAPLNEGKVAGPFDEENRLPVEACPNERAGFG